MSLEEQFHQLGCKLRLLEKDSEEYKVSIRRFKSSGYFKHIFYAVLITIVFCYLQTLECSQTWLLFVKLYNVKEITFGIMINLIYTINSNGNCSWGLLCVFRKAICNYFLKSIEHLPGYSLNSLMFNIILDY